MLTIPPLFAGYVLYGVFTVIMVFALRRAELSLLYPIMALTYVWVAAVSVLWLKEPISLAGMAGVAVIVSGVAVLGKGETVRG
jgi:drug/metabolite transporter (DMT)-like permease